MATTIGEVVDQLRQIRAMSPAIRQLIGRLSADDLSVEELIRGIGSDPILAGRVLRLANSPFYGMRGQIGSLHEAAIVLGMRNIRTLVVAGGVLDAFSGDDRTGLEVSLAVAGGARGMARCLGENRELAFTAGLLHNIGQFVLQHLQPARYREQVTQRLTAEGPERQALEREAFGFDHCELGAEIARQWNFPQAIQDAIRHQHAPPAEPRQPITEIVHVCLSMAGGIVSRPQGADGFVFPLGTWQDCLAEAQEEARQALSCLGVW